MSKSFAVVAVAVLLLAGIYAVGYAGGEAGERTEVNNESWTADPGNITYLDESNASQATYEANVTVEDSNGTELEPESEYKWYPSNGSVKAVNNSTLSDGETAYIWYAYGQPNGQQQRVTEIVASMYRIGGPFVFLLMVGVALGAILKFVN